MPFGCHTLPCHLDSSSVKGVPCLPCLPAKLYHTAPYPAMPCCGAIGNGHMAMHVTQVQKHPSRHLNSSSSKGVPHLRVRASSLTPQLSHDMRAEGQGITPYHTISYHTIPYHTIIITQHRHQYHDHLQTIPQALFLQFLSQPGAGPGPLCWRLFTRCQYP